VRIRPSSKPYKHTVLRQSQSTRASHRISTCFPQWEFRTVTRLGRPQGLKPRALGRASGTTEVVPFPAPPGESSQAAHWSARRYGPSACKCLKALAIFGHAGAEDEKLRKELTLEVLALKVPFGSLLSVSESSPVAGAIQGFNPCNTLDAGRARELQKCAQPATQMLSVHCLYQALRKSAIAYLKFRTEVYRDGTPLKMTELSLPSFLPKHRKHIQTRYFERGTNIWNVWLRQYPRRFLARDHRKSPYLGQCDHERVTR